MSPKQPAPEALRVATWNVNSLRRRVEPLDRFLERVSPDVLCLQETKATTIDAEATAVFHERGYRVVYAGAGAYNGVAIASRHDVREEVASGGFGVEVLDREPRVVSCLVEASPPLRVASVYVPHGRTVGHWHYAYKLEFLAALTEQVRGWLTGGDHVVLAGDVNVAATDSDVFHPDAFVDSTHVTPLERRALEGLFAVGLVDVDVERWGARARRFTWWQHGFGYDRNLGMRLDVIAVDRALADRLDTTWIDHVERGAERPSDHAALIADFGLVSEASSS